ncbi:hypothetical protein ABES25_17650 [Bacillus gobiensis]|uniref:hypothetical protein n=1 Tax=Bacillus gobiensis TaxID=1441095 RepID=UPI003D247A01
MNKKNLKIWSLACFIICLLLWAPNLIFQISSPFWTFTFLVGPIGIALGIFGKSHVFTILNAIMSFSFFIFMFIGYSLFGP